MDRVCTPEIYTCDTSLWFSFSQACLMVVLWSKRWARSSNFSWRISSFRSATPLSCSAFSSLSHACSDNKKITWNRLVPDITFLTSTIWDVVDKVDGCVTLLMSEISFPSWGTKGFWLLALSLLWMVKRSTSRFPFSWNLSEKQPYVSGLSIAQARSPS